MTSDSVEEKRDIAEHWDWASEGYQDRDIDFDSVGYGSGVTEEDLGLLDDGEDGHDAVRADETHPRRSRTASSGWATDC